MPSLQEMKAQVLNDRSIDDADVALLRAQLGATDADPLEELRFLVELRCEAANCSPRFLALFYQTIQERMLDDGGICLAEQFLLMKSLYADGRVTDDEREFVEKLQSAVSNPTPEFEEFCHAVLRAQA